MSPDEDVVTANGFARYVDGLARVTRDAEPRLTELGRYDPAPLPVYEQRPGDGCLHQFAAALLWTVLLVCVPVIAAGWLLHP